MLKILKLASIATLSAPLVLISCSQNTQPEISKIQIDRLKLEQNFTKGTNSATFQAGSIKTFVDDFNLNPENYFISSTPTPSVTAVPFITANINSFLTKSNSTKPLITAEISSNVPSFNSIKFSFKLQSKFKPEIIISDSASVTLDPLSTLAFSMDFRVLVPTIDSEQRAPEINWIKSFFSRTFVNYINVDIEKATLSKTPTQVISEIKNKADFEKIYEMKIPFPSELITGWNYDVVALPNPDSQTTKTSIQLKFTLTNSLFTGINALTPDESTVYLVRDGFKSE